MWISDAVINFSLYNWNTHINIQDKIYVYIFGGYKKDIFWQTAELINLKCVVCVCL